MARTTKVSASSGQGVSRKAYQTARSLGAKGSGAAGLTPLKTVPAGSTATGVTSSRHYPKNGPTGASLNIAYSEREMANPDLGSLVKVAGLKPPKAGKGFL